MAGTVGTSTVCVSERRGVCTTGRSWTRRSEARSGICGVACFTGDEDSVPRIDGVFCAAAPDEAAVAPVFVSVDLAGSVAFLGVLAP